MFVVIFKSKKVYPYPEEYSQYSKQLRESAKTIDGYIDFQNWINEDGQSISVSYWQSLESIREWKNHGLHKEAQTKAKGGWYENYSVEICEVVKSYKGGVKANEA